MRSSSALSVMRHHILSQHHALLHHHTLSRRGDQVEKINGKMNLALDTLDETADVGSQKHSQHAQSLHRLHEKVDRFATKLPMPSPASQAKSTVSYIPKLNLSSLGLGKREPAALEPSKRDPPVREVSVDSSCQTDPLPVWPHRAPAPAPLVSPLPVVAVPARLVSGRDILATHDQAMTSYGEGLRPIGVGVV